MAHWLKAVCNVSLTWFEAHHSSHHRQILRLLPGSSFCLTHLVGYVFSAPPNCLETCRSSRLYVASVSRSASLLGVFAPLSQKRFNKISKIFSAVSRWYCFLATTQFGDVPSRLAHCILVFLTSTYLQNAVSLPLSRYQYSHHINVYSILVS